MKSELRVGITTYRRIAGGFFGFAFYFLGFLLVAMPEVFPNGISGFDAANVGEFLVFVAVITTPAILFPCLFDRFPAWLHTHFPMLEEFFREMLCPSTKS